MKTLVLSLLVLGLIGCSSSQKKEEVVTTTKTETKVEEKVVDAELGKIEDEFVVEEELEVVEVDSFDNAETTIVQQAASIEQVSAPVQQYHTQGFANVQGYNYSQVDCSNCGMGHSTGCNGQVYFDNGTTTTITQSASSSAPVYASSTNEVFTKTSLKSGFYEFPKNGNHASVYQLPSTSSAIVSSVSPGKVLWVEDHSGAWAKVFRRSGPAYVLKKDLLQ